MALRITLSKAGESARTSVFDQHEIRVGRTSANDLVIPEPGVSSTHARILYNGHEVTLHDLESTNGTFVNGYRIQAPQLIRPHDEVYICAYRLAFDTGASSPPQHAGAGYPQPGAPSSHPAGPAFHSAPPQPHPYGAPPQPAEFSSPPMGAELSSRPMAAEFPPMAPEPYSFPPYATSPPAAPRLESKPGYVSTSGPAANLHFPQEFPEFQAPMEPQAFEHHPPDIHGVPAQERDAAHAPPSFATSTFAHQDSSPPPYSPSTVPPPTGARFPAFAPSGPPVFGTEGADSPFASPPHLEMVGPGAVEHDFPPSVLAPAGLPEEPSFPDPFPAPAPHSVPSKSSWPPGPAPREDSFAETRVRTSDAKPLPPGREGICERVYQAVFAELGTTDGTPIVSPRNRVRAIAERTLTEIDHADPAWLDSIVDELTGFGALAPYLERADIRELRLQGPSRAELIGRSGSAIEPADIRFTCATGLASVLARLATAPFDRAHPIIDHHDERRSIYAVHHSVAVGGPIARVGFSTSDPPETLEWLGQQQVLSPAMGALLRGCIRGGLNLGICSLAGADTVPLALALAQCAATHERLVLVRDRAPTSAIPGNMICLQGDPAPGDSSATAMQKLVRAAAGLAPDRLFVLGISGPEAADALHAGGTTKQGIVISLRAESAQAGLHRLSTLLGLTGEPVDPRTRLGYVIESLDLFVVLGTSRDGRTRVTQVCEPTVAPNGQPQLCEFFAFDPNTQRFTQTGLTPSFAQALQQRGIAVDLSGTS